VLRVAHDPDKGDLPGGDRAIVETVDQVLRESNLMCDSGCASEEHTMPVGVERVVTSVWPLHCGFESQEAWGAGVGFVEELSGEAGLGADDEGDISNELLVAEDDLAVLLGHGERRISWLVLNPGDREWVAFQGVDDEEAEVGVTSRLDVHLLWQVHCHSAGISWKSLYSGVGPPLGRVVGAKEYDEATCTLRYPKVTGSLDVRKRWEMCYCAVDPGTSQGKGCHDDVNIQEGLVESVTNWREGSDEDDDHSNSSDHSPGCERIHRKLIEESRPSNCLVLDICPTPSVEEGHKDDNTTKPSVHEVVRIEADLEQANQRVIPPGEDDQGDHVDHGQHAGSPTKLSNNLVMILLTPIELECVSKVASQVKENQDRVEP